MKIGGLLVFFFPLQLVFGFKVCKKEIGSAQWEE
jgi:hypothetical protein